MDQLTHYCQRWHLSQPQRIAQTHTSTVYRVRQGNQTMVLKLLNEVGIRDEARGASALRHYAGRGAAQLIAASDDAHLLEYLAGDDLIALVQTGRDDEAAHIMAQVVTRLHTASDAPPPSDLHRLRRRFQSLFHLAATDTDALFQHGAELAEHLLSHPRDEVVLHGDIHHWNVRQSARGWLAYDPKGLIGESTYDVANALLNPFRMPQITHDEDRLLRHVAIYAAALKTDAQRVLAFTFAHACLSISWSMEDDDDYSDTLHLAHRLRHLLSS